MTRTFSLVTAAILLVAPACGQKAEAPKSEKDRTDETIVITGGSAAGDHEETLTVEAEAPTLVATSGGLLLPAGAAILELVLKADEQRIYLLDAAGKPVDLKPECRRFSFMSSDAMTVADFRRAKDGAYFATGELSSAITDGLSGRIFFAECPFDGVTSALVQVSPDPQRLAANDGQIWYSSGIAAEVLKSESNLRLWIRSLATSQGPAVPVKSVSLQTGTGEFLKLVPKGGPEYAAEIPEGVSGGKLRIGTGKDTITLDIEW